MNVDKLTALLDQHRARQTAYQHLAARYRGAANELARVRSEMANVMPDDEEDPVDALVRQPLPALIALKEGDVTPLGLTMTQIRRLIAAHRQAERLQQEAIAQADVVKDSLALTERLVEYARSRGEPVSL